MALHSLTIFGFTLMEDDPPILNITVGLATLKMCDTVLANGSNFKQKWEVDIGRRQNSFRSFGLLWACEREAAALRSRLARCVPPCLVALLVAIQLGWWVTWPRRSFETNTRGEGKPRFSCRSVANPAGDISSNVQSYFRSLAPDALVFQTRVFSSNQSPQSGRQT